MNAFQNLVNSEKKDDAFQLIIVKPYVKKLIESVRNVKNGLIKANELLGFANTTSLTSTNTILKPMVSRPIFNGLSTQEVFFKLISFLNIFLVTF